MKLKLIAVALALSAIAARPGEWRQHERIDKMTDKKVLSVMLVSKNKEDLGRPYGEVPGALTFSRLEGQEVDVAGFSIRAGIIECVVRCRVMVRFDDEEPVMLNAEPSGPSSFQAVYFEQPGEFLSKVKTAKRIRVQPRVYNKGAPVFEFEQTTPLNW